MQSGSGLVNPLMMCAIEDCDVAVHAGKASLSSVARHPAS